jgi:hypothetical protein
MGRALAVHDAGTALRDGFRSADYVGVMEAALGLGAAVGLLLGRWPSLLIAVPFGLIVGLTSPDSPPLGPPTSWGFWLGFLMMSLVGGGVIARWAAAFAFTRWRQRHHAPWHIT